MATSNAVHFEVVEVPPLDAAGFEIRVLDHRDFTTTVAVIPEYVSMSFGPELSGPDAKVPGAGSITLDADMPMWGGLLADGSPVTALLDNEYLWQVWEDGTLRFEWLGNSVQEVQADESETRQIMISGPGTAEVLRWAKIMPPGFPTPPPPVNTKDPNLLDDLKRNVEFPVKWPAMQMWHYVFTLAQARGTIPWVKLRFTATTDAAGAKWEYVPTTETQGNYAGYRPQMGSDLLDFLDLCTGQDYSRHFAQRAEWVMLPGFRLEARKRIGVNRSGVDVPEFPRGNPVAFFEGGMLHKERTRVRNDIATYVAVRDVNGDFTIAADTAAIRKWHKREHLELVGGDNPVDPVRRAEISHVYLNQRKDEQSEWVIQVPYGLPGRMPFRDYNIGDWVGISTYTPGRPSTLEPYRVLSIAITDTADTTTVELTLQSRLGFRMRQLEAQLTWLTHQVNKSTGAIPAMPNIPPLPPYGSGTDPLGIGIDPNTGRLGTYPFGAGGDGVRVFIQGTDPGGQANPGDFWYDTGYVPQPLPTYTPDKAPLRDNSRQTRERVPGTNIFFE